MVILFPLFPINHYQYNSTIPISQKKSTIQMTIDYCFYD